MRRMILALLLPLAADCQQSYRVYTEHPRLWLDTRRLRLLRREREREAIRWQQLQLLVASGEALPEEPLVRALEYQVAGQKESGKLALGWLLKRAARAEPPDGAELRRLAVAFDWCYPLLEADEKARVVQGIARGIARVAREPGWPAFASGVLAAISVADDWPDAEQALTVAFEKRWPAQLLPRLADGTALRSTTDQVAFLELCHAARDNLNLDLWDQARAFFRQFPVALLLGYYPPAVVIDGHRFRQPAAASSDPAGEGERARIAELLTVAYESNSVETQFLQGWITHDIYRLRTVTGALYEFLWMNPYQPGLSFHSAPLHLHDELAGRLIARSSWDDDAAWIGFANGQLEMYADGRRSPVDLARQTAPIVFPQIAVVPARGDSSFRVRLAEGEDIFVVGLEAGRTYWIKVGDGAFEARVAGKAGILRLDADPGVEAAYELRSTDPHPPPPTLEPKKGKSPMEAAGVGGWGERAGWEP